MYSKAENDVITYLVQGRSNQEIADILFVAEKTIKFHLTNIFKKSQVESRSEFIAKHNGVQKINHHNDIKEFYMDKLPQQTRTQESKIQFVDKNFQIGKTITHLHKMMDEVTAKEINPSTVNAACNCVARLNETINTAIQAARFLNER